MAKQPSHKGGTSRIRLIVLDAELAEGDLTQIAVAVQNALKPTTVVQQKSSARLVSSALSDTGGDENSIDHEVTEDDVEPTSAEPQRQPKLSRPRKPKTPDVLEVDLTSDPSLAGFAEQHPAKSEPERNLVIAAWFKEHRNTDAVTAAHVYTGYRFLKWPAGFEDFAWP